MKMKKGEIWIAISVFLFVIVIILSVVTYQKFFTSYDINGFIIPKHSFNDLMKVAEDNDFKEFQICDVEENKCVTGILLPKQ